MAKKLFAIKGTAAALAAAFFILAKPGAAFSEQLSSYPPARKILETSCVHCHSAAAPKTIMSRLPLFGWLENKVRTESMASFALDKVNEDGRADEQTLDQLQDAVMSGRMPPLDYKIRKPHARISQKEKLILRKWLDDARAAEKPAQKEPA